MITMYALKENIIPLIAFFAFMFVFTNIVKWYIKRAERSMLINAVPGVKSYPIVGTSYMFFGTNRNNLFETIRKEAKQYPYISRVWLGPFPEVVVRKAEYVEKVIGASKNLEKSFLYNMLRPWLGDGLLLSSGTKWHTHRKIITPTFHYSILESFCEVFSEKSKILVEKLKVHCGSNKPFDIYKYITRVALDIICDSAMGTNVHAQEETHNEYVQSINTISKLLTKRMLRVWLHPNFIYKLTKDGKQFEKSLDTLHEYTRSVIEARKAARKKNGNSLSKSKRLAFLDLLLEENSKENLLTTQDIREEVDTFMFEGHDTTTSSVSWIIFLVGLHPEVQEKIFEEMDAIFGDSHRNATLNDLNDMQYLERVIKESLRLYPPVGKFSRKLSEDIQLDQYKIPMGCVIGIHIHYLHRDERFFPDAEKFDPDRFLPENTVGRHPFAYIPFSAGPRNCIGQKFAMYEEKSVLSWIFRNFQIKSMDSRENVTLINELILRPLEGINVTIEQRVRKR